MSGQWKPQLTPAVWRAIRESDWDNAAVAFVPGGIEAQEAAGQRALVRSETLPKDMRGERAVFEAMGITFGEPSDDLFLTAELPPGWKKVATEHSMWSSLVDQHGRKRAGIFYKAAFYNRSAHMRADNRFTFSVAPVGGWGGSEGITDETPFTAQVRDYDGSLVWESFETIKAILHENGGVEERRMQAEGVAWLQAHYPDWKNPLAYWGGEKE